MLYKGLNIVNCDCIRYFQLMKDNQYLAIIDQEGIIKASFIKMNGKIYEYFDIFTIKCLDDYKEFAYPLSFLFRNEPNAKTYIYHICDEYEWNERLKANNLKWAREKLKDSNSNAKLIYEEILKDGDKLMWKWVTEVNPNANFNEVSEMFQHMQLLYLEKRSSIIAINKTLFELEKRDANLRTMFPSNMIINLVGETEPLIRK